ncbi:MAG: flagellin [Balneolales bacterium]
MNEPYFTIPPLKPVNSADTDALERNIKKNLRNGDFTAISTTTRERHAINKNIEKDFIMSMNRINTNLQSMTAQSSLNNINTRLGNAQQKLSTGLRINRAEDDAAGFSIASKLTSRIEGLDQSVRNVGDAKSVLDIAETGMNSIMDILIDMKGRAVQASNDTLGVDERGFIMDQLKALGEEIDNIAGATTFQGMNLLSGQEPDAPKMVDSEGNVIDTSELSTAGGAAGDYTFDGGPGDVYASGGAVYELGDLYADDGLLKLHDATGATVANSLGQDVYVQFDMSNLGISFTNALGEEVEVADPTELEAVFEDAAGTAMTLSSLYSGDQNTAIQNPDDSAIVDGDDNQVYMSFSETVDLGLNFQVGERGVDQLSIGLVETNQVQLGVADGLAALVAGETEGFNSFIDDIDGAIEKLAGNFNQIGMDQNKLSIREENLDQSITSSSAARSRIQDADFASVQSESIRLQILQQTATSSLAQANSSAQSVLGFLQ